MVLQPAHQRLLDVRRRLEEGSLTPIGATRMPIPASVLHSYALDVAEWSFQQEHLIQGIAPDPKTLRVLQCKRLWIEGDARTEELETARRANRVVFESSPVLETHENLEELIRQLLSKIADAATDPDPEEAALLTIRHSGNLARSVARDELSWEEATNHTYRWLRDRLCFLIDTYISMHQRLLSLLMMRIQQQSASYSRLYATLEDELF